MAKPALIPPPRRTPTTSGDLRRESNWQRRRASGPWSRSAKEVARGFGNPVGDGAEEPTDDLAIGIRRSRGTVVAVVKSLDRGPNAAGGGPERPHSGPAEHKGAPDARRLSQMQNMRARASHPAGSGRRGGVQGRQE